MAHVWDESDEPPTDFRLEIASVHVQAEAKLKRELADLGIVPNVSRLVMLSQEPPGYITLLAEAPIWIKVLGGAASIYFGTLLKCAAEDTWKNRAALLKAVQKRVGPQIDKIIKLTKALVEAGAYRSNVTVSFVADDMRFRLSLQDEVEAIDTVARSVHLVQRLRTAVDEIRDRCEQGSFMRYIDVTFTDNGFTLEWYGSGPPWKRYGRNFDIDGKPRGEQYEVAEAK